MSANLDFNKIKAAAEGYKTDMTKFLRDLIKAKGESTEEKEKVYRIKEEMEKVGFDEVWIDQLGNVLGYMGTGDRIIVREKTGSSTLMRAMKMKKPSAAAAPRTSWAESSALYMAQKL